MLTKHKEMGPERFRAMMVIKPFLEKHGDELRQSTCYKWAQAMQDAGLISHYGEKHISPVIRKDGRLEGYWRWRDKWRQTMGWTPH
jgi:hypothetical protein